MAIGLLCSFYCCKCNCNCGCSLRSDIQCFILWDECKGWIQHHWGCSSFSPVSPVHDSKWNHILYIQYFCLVYILKSTSDTQKWYPNRLKLKGAFLQKHVQITFLSEFKRPSWIFFLNKYIFSPKDSLFFKLIICFCVFMTVFNWKNKCVKQWYNSYNKMQEKRKNNILETYSW